MAKKAEMKFEDQMNRLQEIVNELEKDNADLDKSIELYQEGLKLSKSLKDELAKFEKKINELNEDEDE